MNREERKALDAQLAQVKAWSERAETILARREKAHEAMLARRKKAEEAKQASVDRLRTSVFPVYRDGEQAWQALPVSSETGQQLGAIITWNRMPTHQPDLAPAATPADLGRLRTLTREVPRRIHGARALRGLRRLFSSSDTKENAETAAAYLARYYARAVKTELPRLLTRLDAPYEQGDLGTAPSLAHERIVLVNRRDSSGEAVEIDSATALAQQQIPLAEHMPQLSGRPALLDARKLARLRGAIKGVEQARSKEAAYRDAAVKAGDKARRKMARDLLAEMPLDRLREATRDRLRTGPLERAGITTVLQLVDLGQAVIHLPGIGEASATHLLGAAQALFQATFDETPLRIDIHHRTAATTRFLGALRTWDSVRRLQDTSPLVVRAEELSALTSSQGSAKHKQSAKLTHLAVYPTERASVELLRQDIREVIDGAARLTPSPSGNDTDVWDDFTSRPADYFALVAELGFITEDEAKTTGDLPDEIVEAVRNFTLKTDHLNLASLRGYQSFAARFALVQRKVIIGDEMGLGKTVEALAVLAHLHAVGESRFLVICPAAVVTNWMREIAGKSTLRAHRLHGPERDRALRSWTRQGGVGVTTYDTLAWLEDRPKAVQDLACVVVDEAHYIKNPDAQRSMRTADLIDQSPYAVLLTGTPLENRIEEFECLVEYVQPDLRYSASGASPREFRTLVAPAYLRRNQEDVLTELPDLVQVDELVTMTHADAAAYRAAVEEGNFAAMRQAATRQGVSSAKLLRLRDIVDEAESNDRRVIVFSYFRDVLQQVVGVLPGQTLGPLTGSMPAAKRQRLVDEFSAAGDGAVLVSQIVAGGTGLNIQAASVVVICEPQLKPTTEWQAIARAHRMGQLSSVQVHRLLSDEGVDQRIVQILEDKSDLFRDFARRSATAESAPEAYDLSEAELAREIVAKERERLFTRTQGDSE